MAWTRNGTVSVANNSINVNGAGTTFITSKVQPGDAININNTGPQEIARVDANGALTLVKPWLGATAAGLTYEIIPTNSRIGELAQAVSEQTDDVEAMLDGPGAGKFADGTVVSPGMRFLNDQDTGLYRPSADTIGLVTGGIIRARVSADGRFFAGVAAPSTIAPTAHRFARGGAAEGTSLFAVDNDTTATSLLVYSVTVDVARASASAIEVGRHGTTGRSVNARGTLNASGADYAEYMTKAEGCGTIAAGDVCGVDAEGRLTRTWADAISFVVKSTDPAYVGGDIWALHLPPRPEQDVGEKDPAFAARLAPWVAQLEAARVKVDRIAFSGQVPANVDADTLAACEAALAAGEAAYLVAAANGGGIAAQLVRESDMTLPLYMRRIGRLWAIRDGRPWIDVQHG